MATYQTKGIILRKTDHGETDQLFVIYTENKGKVLALGRGTKKIKSKLSGHLKQFAVVDLMIAPGKSYSHIAAAEMFFNFKKLEKDLKKIILASHSLELVDSLTKVGVSESEVFFLIWRYFKALDDNLFKDEEWQIINQAFVIKLLAILGFNPTKNIADNPKKLNQFLKSHLDQEIKSEKFLSKILT